MAKQTFFANKEINLPATSQLPPLKIEKGGSIDADKIQNDIVFTMEQGGKTFTWKLSAADFDIELAMPAKGSADVNKAAGQVAMAGGEMLGMVGKMANNLWIPYALIGIGLGAGAYVGWRRGSGFFGYMGWQTLFLVGGIGISVPVVIKSVRIQADKTTKKLDAISKK